MGKKGKQKIKIVDLATKYIFVLYQKKLNS